MSRRRLGFQLVPMFAGILVLGLNPPDGHALSDLRPLAPKVSVYVFSFIFVAIYSYAAVAIVWLVPDRRMERLFVPAARA